MISNVLVHSLYLAMSCDISINVTGGIFRLAHLLVIVTVGGLNYLLISWFFSFIEVNVDSVLTLYRTMATICTTSFNIKETRSVFKCSVGFSE